MQFKGSEMLEFMMKLMLPRCFCIY